MMLIYACLPSQLGQELLEGRIHLFTQQFRVSAWGVKQIRALPEQLCDLGHVLQVSKVDNSITFLPG